MAGVGEAPEENAPTRAQTVEVPSEYPVLCC